MTPKACWTRGWVARRTRARRGWVAARGADLAVTMMGPLFAPASSTISVLGIVLGFHGRSLEAVAIGALAIVVAMLALVNSALFWVAFGIIGSAVTAV